jgi:hypothetical protein
LSTRISPLLAGVLVATSAHAVLADDDDDEDVVVTTDVAPTWASDIDTCCVTREHPPCVDEESTVVGYRQCTRYGAWGSNLLDPDMFVQVGMNMRHFTSSAPTAASRTATGTPERPRGGGDDALMFDERIGYPLTTGTYLAFDFELGNFANPESKRTDDRDFVLDGLLSLGARGGLGPFSVGAELAGGVMQSSFPKQPNEQTDAIFEARGRAELWLAPWFTVGAAIGASLIDRGDWMAGLYLGVHTWAYAGDRY